jgi:Domain of unknown function (DUF4440)
MKILFCLPSLFLMTALLGSPIVGSGAQSSETVAPSSAAQAENPEQLFQTIQRLDKELFDAVDRCDMKTFGSLLAEHIEFYHDKDGLAVGRQSIVDSVKNNLCGKVKRVLVPGTLEVYPIHGYGAVEIGTHRFLHPWAQDHGEVGEARFIHLWRYQDGAWQITRVISYDHGTAK